MIEIPSNKWPFFASVRRIESPHRAVRLYALRELSKAGERGALDILGRGLREARAAWALARSAPAKLRLFPLARFMRYERKRGWVRKMDRSAILVRLRQAQHEMAAFAWADRLVLEHGIKATPGLLDCLRRPSSPAVSEASAWALGRLGKDVLGEVLDAFRQATRPTVRRLATVLWYLGPDAHGAEKALVRWLGEPDVDAALLALEGAASVAVARAGGRHVWLDREAVAELAMRVFGDGDRAEAVPALGGFGPAAEAALHLLEQLLQDCELRPLALEALRSLDHPGAAHVLLQQGEEPDWRDLLFSPDPRAQQAALEHCRPELLGPRERDRVKELLRSRVPDIRMAAAVLLPPGPWMAEMLDDPWSMVRLSVVLRTEDEALLLRAQQDQVPRVARAAARKREQLERFPKAVSAGVEEVLVEPPEEPARARSSRRVALSGQLTRENAWLFKMHLSDKSREVRWNAARQLVRHGDFMLEALPVFLELCELVRLIELPVPEEPLIECLSHSLPEVRERACWVLSQLGYRGALPFLEKLQTTDPDPAVRRALRDAVDILRKPPAP